MTFVYGNKGKPLLVEPSWFGTIKFVTAALVLMQSVYLLARWSELGWFLHSESHSSSNSSLADQSTTLAQDSPSVLFIVLLACVVLLELSAILRECSTLLAIFLMVHWFDVVIEFAHFSLESLFAVVGFVLALVAFIAIVICYNMAIEREQRRLESSDPERYALVYRFS